MGRDRARITQTIQMQKKKIQINNKHLSILDIQEKLVKTPAWEKGIYEFIMNWFDESDYILQKTSGSTGTPKEIMLKKSAMIASAQSTLNYFNLEKNNTAWLCLPIEYIAGKMMVVRAITGRLNLIITPSKGIPSIPSEPIKFTAFVPLQLQQLIKSGANLSKIENIIIGGAAMSLSLIQQCQTLPSKIFASYGMTETCSHIALQQINGAKKQEHFHVLNNITISKSEDDCLKIQAPNILDKEIETTDIIELNSPTTFKWIGRKDHVINSGGIKISPEEIEFKINLIINAACLIIPIHDEKLGQKLALIFEQKYRNVLNENILEKIKAVLGKHHTPKVVYYISEFPRNKSMKIDRWKVQQLVNNKLKIN